MIRILILLGLIFSSWLTLASSQQDLNIVETLNFFEDETANSSQIHHIKSTVFPDGREVFIHTPRNYDANFQKRYPVLYLLDGERYTKAAIFMAEILASRRKMPEIIIVALPAGDTRDRDYTPNNQLMNSETGYGDADRFQRFLDTELIPYVDNHYRTEPFRVLSGISRGGLFTVSHLLSGSELFDAHFIFSPALYLNDYGIVKNFSNLLNNKEINSRFLYANAGGIENDNIKMSLNKLESALTQSPIDGFKWKVQRLEDDSHGTTPIAGYYHALKKLYRHWNSPWRHKEEKNANRVRRDYIALSNEFGYEIVPDEYRLNNIGYGFLRQNNIEKAIEAFELNTVYYPSSSNVFDSLADALEAKGALEEALNVLEKAMSLIDEPQNSQYKTSISEHYSKVKSLVVQK
jgi:predicted alpha/beta superfamily hydrolase